ncbi:SPOR domain-containing protein [Rhodohalobacter halophilus]|uniref:SPOR domain-containing protein n=1 Tax=Rhodohalobacter halophilus TaxID=1812810 RepID=UPI0009FCC64B|nr:SPOR domain-containing protein [Rhodohalobacter halophilus]
MKNIGLVLLAMMIAVSCATTETVSDSDDSAGGERSPYLKIDNEVVEEFVLEELDEFEQQLYLNRNRLTDQFSTIQHDLPEQFTREVTFEEQQVDRYAGYRVQILSTRDVVHADTTRDHFVAWADSTIDGYKPNAYVHFRQPYYRVRAGDFSNREKAIEFSRLIKEDYPEAWIVHDRIEPERVPADTTRFRFLEIEITEDEPEQVIVD